MAVAHVHQDVLDNGLSELNNVDKVLVLKGYTRGDSYATVDGAGVKVAEDTVSPGDKSIATLDTWDRHWLCNAKAGLTTLISTVQGTDDLHVAYVDTTTSRVLFVTDEITNQTITAGNPIDVPGGEYRSRQPSLV